MPSGAVLEDQPVPPSKLRQGLSPNVDHAVLKALEKSLDKRYASAADMLEAIDVAFHDV